MTNTNVYDYSLGDNDTSWMDETAKCRDHSPEVFFPKIGAHVHKAIQICKACPLQERCGEWAIVNHIDHGVWGGLTENERRRRRKVAS
jgi:WhiB family redox-sensing transcriptional regulator